MVIKAPGGRPGRPGGRRAAVALKVARVAIRGNPIPVARIARCRKRVLLLANVFRESGGGGTGYVRGGGGGRGMPTMVKSKGV